MREREREGGERGENMIFISLAGTNSKTVIFVSCSKRFQTFISFLIQQHQHLRIIDMMEAKLTSNN